MKPTIQELQSIVRHYSEKLSTMDQKQFSEKPDPEKWSKKEVIGHLIDSAQNNLRRFIVGQYDSDSKIIYDQDFWVQANGYQTMNDRDLIHLWRLLNERICYVLESMPVENYVKQLNTGKEKEQLHSLEWLAYDYVKHLKHHLNQVFVDAFNVVYP